MLILIRPRLKKSSMACDEIGSMAMCHFHTRFLRWGSLRSVPYRTWDARSPSAVSGRAEGDSCAWS